MDLEILLNLHSQDELFLNPKRIRLLEAIGREGSISKGAKAAGVSYKSAWDAVHAMNQLGDKAVIDSSTGGKGGGGARLTEYGQRLIKIYGLLGQIETMAVNAVQDQSVSLDSLLSVVSRCALQTSARNQLFAKVTALNPDDISHKVSLALDCGSRIHADITQRSTQRLGLAVGKEVLALIKAPWISLHSHPQTITDSRLNKLDGILQAIDRGTEFDEYQLLLDNNEPLCALVTKQASAGLQLTIGSRVWATFAPEQVILATLN